MTEPMRLMQGNEACVAGALYAGLSFFAGYPITPSTEIAEILAKRLPQIGGKFIQMEDEIASLAACIGASLTGAKVMTATSGPGFSLMQENLGYAIMTETPCVIVNVQRMGPSTGAPTSPSQGDVMQARYGTHGDHEIIVLTPSSVQETFTLTVKAFNLAELLRSPVILLMDEIVGHMREGFLLPGEGELPVVTRAIPIAGMKDYRPYRAEKNGVPIVAPFGAGYRFHVTGLFHGEDGFPSNKPQDIEYLLNRLHSKIDKHKDHYSFFEEYHTENAEIIVVAYGGTARSAQAAVDAARSQGIKAGLLRLITLWPFPEKEVKRVCTQARSVVSAEMNMGQISRELERVLGGDASLHKVTHIDGTLLPPQKILSKIQEAAGND